MRGSLSLPHPARPVPLLPVALLLAALLLAVPGSGTVLPARAADASPDFAASDADGSGTIDQQEYRRRMVDVFYFADADKDGRVTLQELQVIETVDPQSARRADADADGAIEINEFVEYRMRDFTAADADKNGALSPAEVERWNAGAGR